MKKIVFFGMISLIILCIANQSMATTVRVNVTAVRVREEASTNSNIITNLYKDDEVEVLEENGEWYKIQYEGKVGFAKTEFFTKKKETAPPATQENTAPTEPVSNHTQTSSTSSSSKEEPKIQEYSVGETITLANSIKVRLLPNLAVNPKFTVEKSSNITIDAKLGNWYKVSSQTLSGWITKTKLTAKPMVDESPTQEPPVEEPVPPQTTPPAEVVPEEPEKQPEAPPQEPATSPEMPNNKTAVVIVETARVRKAPSKTAGIVDVLDEDDIVTITGEEGDFYKITSSKIGSGYISKTLVKEKNVTSRSATEERNSLPSMEPNVSSAQSVQDKKVVTGEEIITFAKQYLGYPYVLGCSSPEKGFDCSGFTRYIFGHFGFTLGQVAANQTSLGTVIERDNLQTGDLLLFYNDAKTKIGHCGIYMNSGEFIHSANPQRGVVMDNLNTNSYYSQRFVTARRIAGG